MKHLLLTKIRSGRRAAVVAQVAILMLATIMPMGVQAAQLENRQLQLSSSAAGATDVDYEFSFETATAGSVGSFRFEICSNDPFPGEACTAPTGFDASGVGLGDVSVNHGSVAAVSIGGSNNVIDIELSATENESTWEITVSGITNPTTANEEFFARMYTYSDTNLGTEVDNGGLAFATAETVEVTARVQETLQFCVYTDSCGAGGTEADLGILNTSTTETVESYFDIATNARQGVSIQYLGTTLTSGAETIDAFNGGDGNPATSAPGTEQFGLQVSNVSAGTQVAEAAAPFATMNANEYAFLDGDYDEIGTSTGPVEETTFTIEYAGNVAPLTPTGVYSTQIEYIATGLF